MRQGPVEESLGLYMIEEGGRRAVRTTKFQMNIRGPDSEFDLPYVCVRFVDLEVKSDSLHFPRPSFKFIDHHLLSRSRS